MNKKKEEDYRKLTKKELNQIYYITKEIKMWRKKLNEIKNKSIVGTPPLTGTPSGKGGTKNKIEKNVLNQVEIEETIKDLLQKLEREEKNFIKFIKTVDDSIVRQIMMHRYIKLKSWMQVSELIYGRLDKDENCRKMLNRYLAKNGIN